MADGFCADLARWQTVSAQILLDGRRFLRRSWAAGAALSLLLPAAGSKQQQQIDPKPTPNRPQIDPKLSPNQLNFVREGVVRKGIPGRRFLRRSWAAVAALSLLFPAASSKQQQQIANSAANSAAYNAAYSAAAAHCTQCSIQCSSSRLHTVQHNCSAAYNAADNAAAAQLHAIAHLPL